MTQSEDMGMSGGGGGLARFLCLFIFLLAGSAGTKKSPDFGTYKIPRECLAVKTVDRTGVALQCRLDAISNDQQYKVDFGKIQSEDTQSLSVTCAPPLLPPPRSSFANVSLSHLDHLIEIVFRRCQFYDVPSDAFDGQQKTLRYLTIQRNVDSSTTDDVPPLKVQPGSLGKLLQLSALDLSTSRLEELPACELCPLSGLQYLNLSHNLLNDVEALGFGSNSSTSNGSASLLHTLDLSYNRISKLGTGTFQKLVNLQILNLEKNRIEELDAQSFVGLASLLLLDLSGNRLGPRLVADTWLGLGNNLLLLNLSDNGVGKTLDDSTFQHLDNLAVLDVSSNRIEAIEADAFIHHSALVELHLGANRIGAIRGEPFRALSQLVFLDLSANDVEVLHGSVFRGLNGLRTLFFDHNSLRQVEGGAFDYCPDVTNLSLSYNQLEVVPDLKPLKNLEILNLSRNRIVRLGNDTFAGMSSLVGLSLKHNAIQEVPGDIFRDLVGLQVLSMSQNRIATLLDETFRKNVGLTHLDVSVNLLGPDVFDLEDNLRLILLNLSSNQIGTLDCGVLPRSLLVLDISHNYLSSIESSDNLATADSKIQFLDASNNRLETLGPTSLPRSLKFVLLNNNWVSQLMAYTFADMPDLQVVELSYNRLRTFQMAALTVRKTLLVHRPQFSLQGNFLDCDCTMVWLKTATTAYVDHLPANVPLYGYVQDLSILYCWVPEYDGVNRDVSLITKVPDENFLCQFHENETSVCPFDESGHAASGCTLECPASCKCHHDRSWSIIVVYCSWGNATSVPPNIPVSTSILYLDGNDIPEVDAGSFGKLANLRRLYLNDMGLAAIGNGSFVGMTSLEELHLERNGLRELAAGTFEGLVCLSFLDLSLNRLVLLQEEVFWPIQSSLATLRLDGNRLTTFPVWTLTAVPHLMQLSLADNPWSCDCQYLDAYRKWLQQFASRVTDVEQLFCKPEHNDTAIPLIAFNASFCVDAILTPGHHNVPVTTIVAGVSASFVTIGVICVLLFVYRREMQVLVYSRYGVRLFHRASTDDDAGKLFDAFVSYSSLDERFVVYELLPKLEGIEAPYRLCLHQRNFLAGAYIAESILQAVESSRRTILVLSDNFISSEWCRFEFKSAHVQMLRDRCNRVIVVVLGDIPDNLDPEMKLYMRTNTYLTWGDKLFWEKLYFAMPEPSTTTTA